MESFRCPRGLVLRESYAVVWAVGKMDALQILKVEFKNIIAVDGDGEYLPIGAVLSESLMTNIS